jgi:N utilization substance protein B
MAQITSDHFPLSKTRTIKGSRRLAREKAMQILMAKEIAETDTAPLFTHIFFRKFNFGDTEEKQTKLLNPEEIYELESDIPIEWDNEEIDFGRMLIAQTLDNQQYINDLIRQFAENWDFERIAIVDRILMQLAVSELLYFNEIPTKVSINEAIDIAKKYSTSKSSTFINGVLDSVHEHLQANGLIKKTGRGLLE